MRHTGRKLRIALFLAPRRGRLAHERHQAALLLDHQRDGIVKACREVDGQSLGLREVEVRTEFARLIRPVCDARLLRHDEFWRRVSCLAQRHELLGGRRHEPVLAVV